MRLCCCCCFCCVFPSVLCVLPRCYLCFTYDSRTLPCILCFRYTFAEITVLAAGQVATKETEQQTQHIRETETTQQGSGNDCACDHVYVSHLELRPQRDAFVSPIPFHSVLHSLFCSCVDRVCLPYCSKCIPFPSIIKTSTFFVTRTNFTGWCTCALQKKKTTTEHNMKEISKHVETKK